MHELEVHGTSAEPIPWFPNGIARVWHTLRPIVCAIECFECRQRIHAMLLRIMCSDSLAEVYGIVGEWLVGLLRRRIRDCDPPTQTDHPISSYPLMYHGAIDMRPGPNDGATFTCICRRSLTVASGSMYTSSNACILICHKTAIFRRSHVHNLGSIVVGTV